MRAVLSERTTTGPNGGLAINLPRKATRSDLYPALLLATSRKTTYQTAMGRGSGGRLATGLANARSRPNITRNWCSKSDTSDRHTVIATRELARTH